mgnify:CR=1 FL=1
MFDYRGTVSDYNISIQKNRRVPHESNDQGRNETIDIGNRRI